MGGKKGWLSLRTFFDLFCDFLPPTGLLLASYWLADTSRRKNAQLMSVDKVILAASSVCVWYHLVTDLPAPIMCIRNLQFSKHLIECLWV